MGAQLVPAGPTTLPSDYVASSTLDLRQDRRAAVIVQAGLAAVITGLVVLALTLDLPLDSSWSGWAVALVTVGCSVVYMVGHELTHGAVLWWLTGQKPTYAVRLPYLTTGSRALLTRRAMILAALAPLVLWGVLLLAVLPVVPQDLFLTWYVVLGLNLAGSSGDVLQAWVASRLPASALLQDDGSATTVFLPTR